MLRSQQAHAIPNIGTADQRPIVEFCDRSYSVLLVSGDGGAKMKKTSHSHDERLVASLRYIRSAIELLDDCGAPGHIAARLDHAASDIDDLISVGSAPATEVEIHPATSAVVEPF